ncbi:hypothetical protein M1293_01210 [Candidatus Parvarchaeota archaeon]|nr:hypothetical protein [Candidatus Parvarchaeota archaeon]
MEIIPVGTTSVQYQGLMDDQNFYNFMKDTLQGIGYKVNETSYIQFAGQNYAITWVAKKFIDDYMAYRITIKLDYRGLTETTATKDGKQIKMKTGTVQITLVSDILLDYLDKWAVGVSKLIRPIFDKMNKDVLVQRRNTFENEIQNIKSSIQSHFG